MPDACPAALIIGGEHHWCDWPVDESGKHSGWAHANRDTGAIWIGRDEHAGAVTPDGK
jgi:hypothetical protein